MTQTNLDMITLGLYLQPVRNLLEYVPLHVCMVDKASTFTMVYTICSSLRSFQGRVAARVVMSMGIPIHVKGLFGSSAVIVWHSLALGDCMWKLSHYGCRNKTTVQDATYRVFIGPVLSAIAGDFPVLSFPNRKLQCHDMIGT
jgi:hypothetical protein